MMSEKPKTIRGEVAGLFIADRPAVPTRSVDSVHAVPGAGLEGDRYFAGAGTSKKKSKIEGDKELTLIEAEAIDTVAREHDIALPPGATRRNVITRGVPLNDLVGREFSVGDVRIRGLRLCEPCGHLEKLTQPGVCAAFVHRGGLRARILSEGTIRVGDAITISQLERSIACA